jgi:hypothetical protein
MDLVLTFAGIHDALAAEKAARGLGLEAELVPLPSAVKSDCGFGLLLSAQADDGHGHVHALEEAGIEITDAYRVTESPIEGGTRKEKRYERIG